MPPINNNPINTPGYFHRSNDEIKTTTALRSTYNPSFSDKITNRFARNKAETTGETGQKSKRAAMVNSVRNLGLSIRLAANKTRLNSARNKLSNMMDDGADESAITAQGHKVDHLRHVAYRLKDKQGHAAAALEGKLDDKIASSNDKLKERLKDNEYVPLTGLSEVKQYKVQSHYLSSLQDNHRIKIHSEGPPRLAAMVAQQVSADYDRGASGIAARSRSTMQHALVGIQGAALWGKGKIARKLLDNPKLDAGAQARMQTRIDRSAEKRTMLRASLGGNEALRRAYREVVEKQIDAAEQRLFSDDPTKPRYVVRAANNGVKPPQTRYWQRRVDEYYRQPEVEREHAAEDSASDGYSDARSTLSISDIDAQSIRAVSDIDAQSIRAVSDIDAQSIRAVSDIDAQSIRAVSDIDAEREQIEAQADTTPRKGRLARFAQRVSNARDDFNVKKSSAQLSLAKFKLKLPGTSEKTQRREQQVEHHRTAAQKTQHAQTAGRSMWEGKLRGALQSAEFQTWQNKTFPAREESHQELPWTNTDEPSDGR